MPRTLDSFRHYLADTRGTNSLIAINILIKDRFASIASDPNRSREKVSEAAKGEEAVAAADGVYRFVDVILFRSQIGSIGQRLHTIKRLVESVLELLKIEAF